MERVLREALEAGRMHIERGECASYIPELARADKNDLGICVITRSVDRYTAGDTKKRFTIQSISKVISLAIALERLGYDRVFDKMNMEPSGDAFNSLLKLDMTSDKPFNPMINAGALATVGYLIPEMSFEEMLEYTRRVCMDPGIVVDEKVYQSEMANCARNRAIGYLLQSKGILESDVEKTLERYTRMCSLSVTAESLGMYDGSGEFAVRVGLPSKSGVGGGILAVVEKRMGIGIYGPALDAKGNSIAGQHILEYLSRNLNLHMFGGEI